jgi:hypothetical protein
MRVNKERCTVYDQTDDEGGYWAKLHFQITVVRMFIFSGVVT